MKRFGFPEIMREGESEGGGGESESDYEDAYAEATQDYGPAVGHTDFSSSSVGRGALADMSFPGMEPDMDFDRAGFENVDWDSYGLSGRDSFQGMVNNALNQQQESDPFGFGTQGTFGQQGFADRFGGVNDTTHAIGASQYASPGTNSTPPDLSWALAPGPLDQPVSDWFGSLGLLANTPGSPWGAPTSITVNAQPHSLGDQTDPGGSGPGPGIGPSTPTSSSPVSGPVAGFAPEASPFGVGYTPSPESWAADGSFDPYGSGLYGNSLQNPDVQALIKNSPLTAQSYAYSQKYGWLPPEIAAAYQSQFGAPKEEGPSGNRARASAFLGQTGFMPYWYDELPRVASLMDAYNARDYLSNIPAAAPRAAPASAPSFAGVPMTAAPPMTFDLPSQGQLQVGPTPPGMDQQQFIQSMYSQVQAPSGTQAPSPNHYFDGNQWQEATASTLPSWMQYNQA
jgi:hypothetical protein